MRGRSSEGVDFLDACARAVLVVGIPYPPLYDVTVRLKRAFNHEHQAMLGSGDDWYAAEAFRAVNQAVGESQQQRYEEPYAFRMCIQKLSPEVLKLSSKIAGRVHDLTQQLICCRQVRVVVMRCIDCTRCTASSFECCVVHRLCMHSFPRVTECYCSHCL